MDATAITCMDVTCRMTGKSSTYNRKYEDTGLRLSWPNANDSRRSIVAKPLLPRQQGRVDLNAGSHIVQVSPEDLEMHYDLARPAQEASTQPLLQVPMVWDPSPLEVGSQDLLQYFQWTASRSLAIFSHSHVELGNLLLRISLGSNTESAKAALQSLLAFSALHRHKIYLQAVQLKTSAIETLASAMRSPLTTEEAIQQVCAGMLLCSFEIQQASCTTGQWPCYIDGVKHVIEAAHLGEKVQEHSELAVLLDWVYYHDVLARFSQHHWHRGTSLGASAAPMNGSGVPLMTGSNLGPIHLLAEVCDAVATRPSKTAPVEDRNNYHNFIKILDWRIRDLSASASVDDDVDSQLMLEAFKLAMLVYLNLASGNLLNQAVKTQQHIDKAFKVLSQMDSCCHQLPLFILGCEARDDDQRATVLDLMARTERIESSRSLNYTRVLMQAVWTQDDLAKSDINYQLKLGYVISCCVNMPSFV